MQIGSDEHKALFCQTFLDSHRAYEPAELPWPVLDEVSIARLRAIPVWSMALEVEINAGSMLAGYARGEKDPLVRKALELQGYEEARHGRILAEMIGRYGLKAKAAEPTEAPTRSAFVNFGYNECVDSFAGFGIFRLARDARVLPDTLTSIFTRVLEEEARHIVFFVNWIAWDRDRRGCRGPLLQAIPALASYGAAIVRRVKGGSEMAGSGDGGDAPLNLFADVMKDLTPAKFLRACVEENDRYMRAFDPRLLRPRVIPTLGKIALAVIELIDRLRAAFNRGEARA
ncbi:MAG TPA: ferritin-like domain-containing protein [Candidatus Tumulicola sp.]